MNITAINTNFNTYSQNQKQSFGRNIVPKIVSNGYDKFTDQLAKGITFFIFNF